MYCNQLTDISALDQLIKLEELDLSRCDKLIDISALAKLTNLQRLGLEGCRQLTHDQIKNLETALPNLAIHR